jgi:hypothetical protein
MKAKKQDKNEEAIACRTGAAVDCDGKRNWTVKRMDLLTCASSKSPVKWFWFCFDAPSRLQSLTGMTCAAASA